MLFGFLFNFDNSFSFFPHKTYSHFLCSIFDIIFSFVSSDGFLHIFIYATFFCCISSFTSSFNHHVSPWFFLPFFFPHTSSQACSILILKVFHRLGASTSTNSLTLSCNFVFMLFFFNFQTLLKVCWFFTTLLNFLLSMCYHQPMLQFSGNDFHVFNYFLLFLPTNTKSILVSLPPILYVIFLCSFSNHVFATHNSFSSQNSSSLLPSTFPFANSISTMDTLKTINPSPNMSVEVPNTKNHFTRVLQILLACHVIIKLIFLAL